MMEGEKEWWETRLGKEAGSDSSVPECIWTLDPVTKGSHQRVRLEVGEGSTARPRSLERRFLGNCQVRTDRPMGHSLGKSAEGADEVSSGGRLEGGAISMCGTEGAGRTTTL